MKDEKMRSRPVNESSRSGRDEGNRRQILRYIYHIANVGANVMFLVDRIVENAAGARRATTRRADASFPVSA